MATEAEMKQELMAAIKHPSLKDRVEEEVAFMGATDGLDGKPILGRFYKIWKDNQSKTGHENAINSWTAYAIGMTEKKPEPTNQFLPKRRSFARKGFPDIDTDFDYEHRDEIYNYIIKTYGQERVGNIGTYSGMKMKSYIRRVVKALDPTRSFYKYNPAHIIDAYARGRGKINREWETDANAKADEIVKSLPPQRGAVLKIKDEIGEEHVIKSVKDAYKWCPEFAYYIDQYRDILSHSYHIEGLLSVYGVHAAGIVISDVPLDRIAPLRQTKIFKRNDDGEQSVVYATQYAYEDLETLGLIKFDILALSTLSVVARCVKMIKERYGIIIDVHSLELNDERTFDLYRSGDLVGVFQCEEDGMMNTMTKMGVDSFDDIMAGVALYRPGPLASIPQYCDRKHGREPVTYYSDEIEPYVKPYLERTYGVLTYQEQVMQIFNSLAGFSISDGYVIIKAVGKKDPVLLKKYQIQFVAGCVKNGIDEQVSTDYWNKYITPFASYGFNASHACAYAYLSYTTAYLKANFPEAFICCYLNVEIQRANYERVEQLEQEARRMGIDILPRSINKCKMEYEIVAERDKAAGVAKSQIRPSIMCKGLSRVAGENVVANQKYKNIRALAEQTDYKLFDKKAMESLVLAGFFDGDNEKKNIVNNFGMIREDLKKAQKKGVDSVDIFG